MMETERMAVWRAQLQSALSNIYISLAGNAFIASSAAFIIYIDHRDWTIFLWLTLAIALNLARIVFSHLLIRKGDNNPAPDKSLRHLTLFALIGGLLWIPIPIYFTSATSTQSSAYVVFIVGGITTGAIIQSLAYWRISIAFGGPLLLATFLKLMLMGQGADYVAALNLLFLMAMLFRVAVNSEANFCKNTMIALQATELANSLQMANDEVRKSNQTLARLASTDPLTGLANRSVFNKTLAAATHDHQPKALVLLDSDHFKQVNDRLGHLIGDQLLNTIAMALLDLQGQQVTPVRLGGDEFSIVVLGPECRQRAFDIAAKIQKAVREIRLPPEQTKVTASIGISADEKGALTSVELYSSADGALYAAKAAGRDCLREAASG